jgi:acetylglutamate kinase
MLPKLENAFNSIGNGVSKVIICSSADIDCITGHNSGKGTTIEL